MNYFDSFIGSMCSFEQAWLKFSLGLFIILNVAHYFHELFVTHENIFKSYVANFNILDKYSLILVVGRGGGITYYDVVKYYMKFCNISIIA